MAVDCSRSGLFQEVSWTAPPVPADYSSLYPIGATFELPACSGQLYTIVGPPIYYPVDALHTVAGFYIPCVTGVYQTPVDVLASLIKLGPCQVTSCCYHCLPNGVPVKICP